MVLNLVNSIFLMTPWLPLYYKNMFKHRKSWNMLYDSLQLANCQLRSTFDAIWKQTGAKIPNNLLHDRQYDRFAIESSIFWQEFSTNQDSDVFSFVL